MSDAGFTDEELRAAEAYEADAWEGMKAIGVPRCLGFPGRWPCCGALDEQGNSTGECPPPVPGEVRRP